MQCDSCGHQNRSNAKFCSECGKKLEKLCPQCNESLLASARFCDNCGSSINGSTSIPDDAAVQSNTEIVAASDSTLKQAIISSDAERRQLTVMFCDMVDSTGISERLDPEDLSNVFAQYRSRCRSVIESYGGHLARYIGDGLLVYFGYPRNFEDAAFRAVSAALEIITVIQALDKDISELKINLSVRVGIYTGEVVVGDIGTGEQRELMGVVGDVPNIAARLQSIAQPDSIIIGDRTRRLIEGRFELNELGLQSIKGLSQPVQVFKVVGGSDVPSRFEASAKKGLTHLIGRDAEMSLLNERWKQIEEGDGQVLLLSGEAGIGKSRILKRFRDQLKSKNHLRYMYYSSAHHQSSAFYPVISQVEHSLEFDAHDSNEIKLEKIEKQLKQLNLPLKEFVPLYSFLLNVPTLDRYPEPTVSPQQLKLQVIEALISHFSTMSLHTPILMIVEDLHWLDPSTFEMLERWIEELKTKRCFLILTFRPEFQPPWKHHSYFTTLTLNRLSRKESSAIVSEITKGKSLPKQVLDDIIAKTDGVPLFLEELTKTVLESGELESSDTAYSLRGSLPSMAIPESLQDSLMARLDQLSKVKELAQLAATFGRRFSHELIASASGLPEAELNDAIEKLLDAELVFRQGTAPDYVYEFKHAMVQDIAYQTLLKSTRQRYHLRFAELLENKFSETVENNPELIAHHYSEAQIPDVAAKHWYLAGQKATSRSANLEALDHINKGLLMMELIPDSAQRAKQELELQIALAVPLTSVKGYASPEVQQTYIRARELCVELGDTPQLFPSLYGMWRFYLLRADYSVAQELGHQLIDIAKRSRDPVFCAAAPRSLGATCFYQGQLADSHRFLKQVLTLQTANEHRSRALLFDVVDVEVVSHSYNAWVLWLQGYPDQAVSESEKALELAHQLNHQFSIALATSFASWTFQFCGDKSRTLETADKALELSQKYGFKFWVGWAKIMRTWSEPDSISKAQAVELAEKGLEEWQVTGSRLGKSYFQALLAETAMAAGQYEKSCEILSEAQEFIDKTGEGFWQPEIHRLKGELLILSPSVSDTKAEFYLQTALDVAASQQSKSLQLRAAISLYRFRRQQDNVESSNKTYQLLKGISNSFNEGFETTDLKNAKSLLSSK